MLVEKEKSKILEDFPNIKLSYENVVHKKVCADYVVAIPKGKKCYAWFTKDFNTNKNVCYLLELGPKRQIENVKMITCCFHSDLSYGTILYGTIFYQENARFFSIEDIFYYSSNYVGNQTWLQKLCKLEIIMANDIKQVAYNKNYIVFGLPLMSKTLEHLLEEISKVHYSIYSVQFRCYNKRNTYDSLNYLKIDDSLNKESNENKNNVMKQVQEVPFVEVKQQPNINTNTNTNTRVEPLPLFIKANTNQIRKDKEKIFTIKADISNDIYHLYENDTSKNYVGVAGISDYKTSVMMNNLYRIIKENKNLDSLEESDDEEEFENEKEDRYVDLNKELTFVCTFNYKFKRWCPVRLV